MLVRSAPWTGVRVPEGFGLAPKVSPRARDVGTVVSLAVIASAAFGVGGGAEVAEIGGLGLNDRVRDRLGLMAGAIECAGVPSQEGGRVSEVAPGIHATGGSGVWTSGCAAPRYSWPCGRLAERIRRCCLAKSGCSGPPRGTTQAPTSSRCDGACQCRTGNGQVPDSLGCQ